MSIDHLGRRRSLLSGLLIQLVAMLYIAIFLTVKSSSDGESLSTNRAAIVAIAFMYFVGIGWTIGWNSIQYLINAEIFPLHVCATGSSLLMCFHYANRYGLSKVCLALVTENPSTIATMKGSSIHIARRHLSTKRNLLVLLDSKCSLGSDGLGFCSPRLPAGL